ncbi:hypothetical protein BX611_1368 [Lutibacter oceani]|uniref:VWA domain-containing protein n=1 Tax=Lutibacter oceani TaxID=1853311 RepID=A0A3D9RPI5_9FLAO|nr:VWA domain-containing protein [Lutibacter oceani]REE81829.1 hypothetical protein BX611_1368 [Lutibacter oceani]
METETLLYIILAVFSALTIAVFQYIFKNKEKSQLNYWLSFLRFLSVFTLLLLIINPSIKKNNIEIVKPNLLIAVDNSKSIHYNLQDKNIENLIKKLKNDNVLNNKYSIDYFKFGNGLQVLDSLSFNESQTDLSIPFLEFSKMYKDGINPTILVSDGNQTKGTGVEFINYKSPVFSYMVGDTTIFEDISISKLNVNKYTYINNKLPVELFVNYYGNKNVSKKLNIFDQGTKVYSKTLNFSTNDNVKIESFYLTASSAGTHYYTATIETLENEQNILNNTKNFSINVIGEDSKILILTSIIHPDLGMLKKSIESNKQRSVTIFDVNKFKGNVSDYQLVILYQPTNLFENVFKQITNKKTNYLIISGLSTDWEFLNKLQTYFKKNVLSQTEEYQPIFNSTYESFVSNNIGFSSFAPIEDIFGNVTFSVPINTLLFQKIGSFETEKPMLATFHKNTQKAAILFGENSWRWRMNSFSENKSFELFDGFISNLIQYLSSDLKNNRLNVTINNLYYTNETIEVTASYLDENYNFDDRAKLWITITNKESNYIKKIPFAVLNNKFNAVLSNIPSGEFSYLVTVENQKPRVSGSFKILPFEVEQQFTKGNNSHLKNLTLKTEGEIFYNNQSDQLIASLKNDTRFKSTLKLNIIETPLINWKWLLGFIILSLSIEWFLRKYFGKI